MQVSAEARWFWRGKEPNGLGAWFLDAAVHGCPAGGSELKPRTDEYVVDPTQVELGVKRRDIDGAKPGAGYEVKGLVQAAADTFSCGPFSGRIEIWTKWKLADCEISGGTVRVSKARWMRRFKATSTTPTEVRLNGSGTLSQGMGWPARGCNVEWTRITVSGETWWSFGFESFGTLGTVEADLQSAATLLQSRQPPAFTADLVGSYPAWLAALAK